MLRLAPAALAALALVGCDGSAPAGPVPFADLAVGDALRVEVTGTTVIRDRPSWERFWAAHVGVSGSDGTSPAAPEVDFNRQVVVGAFYGGSSRSGCTSEVDVVAAVRAEGGGLEVELAPLPELGPCRALVYPLDVAVVDVAPSDALDVRFVGEVPR